jgi:adenylate cyclase
VQSDNIRSFMCTPLWTERRVIGLIYLDSPESAPLSSADLDVLQALGSYAAASIEHAHASQRAHEHLRFRERLHRHYSSAVTERLLDQAAAGAGHGSLAVPEAHDVTVLIAEIEDFPERAKRTSAGEAAHFLETCFSVMCDAVLAQDGTLDKFDREALVAVFGAPLPQPDHADRAVRAAEALRDAVSRLPIDPLVVLRIAVNSGRGIVGEIGSPTRRDYTVVGEVVNACWKMLSSTCRRGEIAISESTRERLGRHQNE